MLVGAGDIASCGSSGDEATAALLDGIAGTVFTAGDNVYDEGTASQFANCYNPSWGRHKARTKPSPGNHDYGTANAAGYCGYFGAVAGCPAAYYAYDCGPGWRCYALNSERDTAATGGQVTWLTRDLAQNPRPCVLAYWHKPYHSSGSNHGSHAQMRPIFRALYDAGADVVVAGHDHLYERFAPQNPDGAAEGARGIREFTAGTGGKSLYRFGSPLPNSEKRINDTYGVLKFTLSSGQYDWDFIAVGGQARDSGRGQACH